MDHACSAKYYTVTLIYFLDIIMPSFLRQKGSGLLNSLTECDSECVIAHVVENADYQSSLTLRVEKLGLDLQK